MYGYMIYIWWCILPPTALTKSGDRSGVVTERSIAGFKRDLQVPISEARGATISTFLGPDQLSKFH